MADYNPHAPYVVGNEFVPIIQANYQPDDITERGYRFILDHGVAPVTGVSYMADFAKGMSVDSTLTLAVYPAGLEDRTGPIEQVIIPMSRVTITGTGGSVTASTSAFETPADTAFAIWTDASVGDGIGLSFNTSAFSNQLQGKRILNVELLYTMNGDPQNLAQMHVNLALSATADVFLGNVFLYSEGLEGSPLNVPTEGIASVQFGDLNPFWQGFAVHPYDTRELFPWRYADLARLDESFTPSNLKMEAQVFWRPIDSMVGQVKMGYAALRVTYCEEQRLLYGGRRNYTNEPVGPVKHRLLDTNYAYNTTVLPPGNYTVTQTFRQLTYALGTSSPVGLSLTEKPTMSATKQLNELPSVRGVQINATRTLGSVYTKQPTDEIPLITLNTIAAIVTGSHAYGTQIAAPVYSGISPEQSVNVAPYGTPSSTFSQVRFYARRFGRSSIPPLVLRSTTDSSLFASITAEEFDALTEIVDGWKEVTLPLSTAATFVTASHVFRWESLAREYAQWQILGASAVAGGPFATTGANYYAPNVSPAVQLSWKQPNQSAVTADPQADASLVLSV